MPRVTAGRPEWITGRLVYDAADRIARVDPELAGGLGYRPRDLIGVRGIDLVAPTGRLAVLAAARDVRSGRQPAVALAGGFLAADGRSVPAQMVLSAHAGIVGDAPGLVATVLIAATDAATAPANPDDEPAGASAVAQVAGVPAVEGSAVVGSAAGAPPGGGAPPPVAESLQDLVSAAAATATAVQALIAATNGAIAALPASGAVVPTAPAARDDTVATEAADGAPVRPAAPDPARAAPSYPQPFPPAAGSPTVPTAGPSAPVAGPGMVTAPTPTPGDATVPPASAAVETDSLTGLATRSVLLSAMAAAARAAHTRAAGDRGTGPHRRRRSEGRARGCAVLLVDLDAFKAINDAHGHDVGDEVLVHVAERLRACVRPSDLVVRFGGDEFVVLCHDAEAARAVATRIVALLAPPIETSTGPVSMTASVGISDDSIPFVDVGELLTRADVAMYRAKELGKNRFFQYDRALHERVVAADRTRRLLQRAASGDRIRVHYQPIMTIDGARMIGVEAVARVVDDGGRTLLPADFLQVAERAGLMATIDAVVLTESCRCIGEMMRSLRRPLAVSVNVSTGFIGRADLVETVERALADADLSPAALMLEVAESALIDLDPPAIARLTELRALGVRVALDNFGAGFAPLSLLRRLPLSHVKVDRPCISRMMTDDRDAAVIEAVTWLVGQLGIVWIAEGVETDDEWRAVRRFGPGYAQGFLFAAPLTADALARRLRGGDFSGFAGTGASLLPA